jgi:hypothetical protein
MLLGGLGRMLGWHGQWRREAARHVRDWELASYAAATLTHVSA